EGALRQQPLRVSRAGGLDHRVPGLAQRAAERPQNLFLVVNEQDCAAVHQNADRWTAAPAASGAASSGNSITTSVPVPGTLVTAIVPPSPSITFFAIGRPRPVPPRVVVKYGSKMRARSAGSMPEPRSATTICT